jgi:hypothetical protein
MTESLVREIFRIKVYSAEHEHCAINVVFIQDHTTCIQRYLTLIDCGLVYTATFQPMGEILRLQRHWQIADISVHYHNIGGGVGGRTASALVKTL